MRTSPFKTKTITRKSRRHNVRNGVGSTSELVTVAEPVIPRGPWLVGIPLYLLGLFLGRVWLPGDTEQVVFSLVFLCAGAVIGGFSWAYAKARTRFQRWHATATPPLFVLILVVPLCSGWGRYSALVMLTYWVVLSGGWVARVARSVWGDGADMHTQEAGGSIASSLGLDGVVVSKVERHGKPGKRPVRITSRWSMRGVEGYEDIAKAATKIRHLAKARHVRIRPVEEDPQAADVTVVLQDVLRNAIPHPGPSGYRSIMDPLVVGMRQDGSPEEFVLMTPEGACRYLFAGVPGSGKSVFLFDVLAETAGREDIGWVIIDTVKAGQTVGPFAPLFDTIAETKQDALRLLERLEREVSARSAALGENQTWYPGCGFDALGAWIEEGADITGDPKIMKRITALARACRSVGIILVLSLQRPSAKTMSTDARAMFTGAVCHGLDDEETPKMILSASTRAAGAHPENWSDTFKGAHYLEAPNVARADWSEECRSFLPTVKGVQQIISRAAGIRAGRVLWITGADTPETLPVVEPSSCAVSKEEAVGVLVQEFGSGVWPTKSLTPRWKELTGAHRATMHRYLEAHPSVEKNDDGTWRFANGSVRPDA